MAKMIKLMLGVVYYWGKKNGQMPRARRFLQFTSPQQKTLAAGGVVEG